MGFGQIGRRGVALGEWKMSWWTSDKVLHLEVKTSCLCNTLSENVSHGNPFLSEDKLERFLFMSPEISMLGSKMSI
jgi:hypothetical protein